MPRSSSSADGDLDVQATGATDERSEDVGADEGLVDPPRPDWLAGRAWDRNDVLVAAGIGVLVIIVAYTFRSIIVPTDPWHYVRSAREFPSSDWVPLGYTRYGIILASILPAKLFGNAQAAYYFWPMLSSGLLAGSTYLLGRRWWGPVAGAVAVVLLISNTVVFYNLSRGYPDIMSMALFLLALVVALRARDALVSGRTPWAALLAVGFLLGWGFEVRETSLLAWPLVVVLLWRRDRLIRTALLVLAPVLAWAAVDLGISSWAYGDALLKLHTLTGMDISRTKTDTGALANPGLVGQPRHVYWTFIPRQALKFAPGGVWMVSAGAIALVGLVVRDKRVRLMSAWFVGVYALTVLAGGGFDPLHPSGRLDVKRYWIPFVPPIALVVGALVVLAGGWLGKRFLPSTPPRVRALPAVVLAVLVCVGPVLSVAGYATSSASFAPSGAASLEQLRSHLASGDSQPRRVWTDWETKRILPAYQRPLFGGGKVWSSEVLTITGKGAEPEPGDYVLLFGPDVGACGFCRNALAPWTMDHPDGPPASWERTWVSSDGNLSLYRVE